MHLTSNIKKQVQNQLPQATNMFFFFNTRFVLSIPNTLSQLNYSRKLFSNHLSFVTTFKSLTLNVVIVRRSVTEALSDRASQLFPGMTAKS